MRNTFKILFYIKRNALLRNGNAPIMARITVNGERTQLTTNHSVKPQKWDSVRGRVRGRSDEARQINLHLSMMYSRLMRCYDRLISTAEPPTPYRIKDMYLGGNAARQMLLQFFSDYLNEFKTMVGVTRSRSSYYKYRCVYKHLAEFIARHYECDDLPFYRLDRRFVTGFHSYINQESQLKHNTVWVYMIALKHIVMQARSRGFIKHDIFLNYRLHCEFVPRNYLTLEEVHRILKLDLRSDTQRLVRDLFIFSCYTGLSYIDIRNLRFDHLQTIDSEIWINTSRTKTGTAVGVRLFDVPLSIIARYSDSDVGDRIFRVPSNGYCNNCLREIMPMAGIRRRVTFHTGRHTFATSVTLSQGVRIETISKLLGHKNIRTTQIYASVTHSSVRSEMNRLQKVIMDAGRMATA